MMGDSIPFSYVSYAAFTPLRNGVDNYSEPLFTNCKQALSTFSSVDFEP